MSTISRETQPVATQPAPRPIPQMVMGCLVIPLLLVIGLSVVAWRVWTTATAQLTVPNGNVLLVRSTPTESAPLLARFGAGQQLTVIGRSADWRWLEVELWDGLSGWALRPLDTLVWQLRAAPSQPQADPALPTALSPVTETVIAIAGGAFTMGSPAGLGEEDETPAHKIILSPFAIDRTEVTVGHYWACVAAEACAPPTSSASQTHPHYVNDVAFSNHPIINVTWNEAKAYCNWRGKRLPTEAEWEMAAGWNSALGAKMPWPWGNEATSAEANLAGRLPDTAPVGAFATDRSPAGVLEMGGNVREWVVDWYKVDYYRLADERDPSGPTNRRGEGAGRVVRGGSFAHDNNAARTANRSHEEPAYGYATVGFRCVQD